MPGPMGHGRAGAPVEKADDFGGALKELMRFSKRYIPAIVIALILGVGGAICQIIGPDYLGDMTDEITKGLPALVHGKPVLRSIDMTAVTRIGWTLVALYVGYALLSYVQSWMMATVTQRTAQRLRAAIDVKMNKLPLKYFDEHSTGRRDEPHHERRGRGGPDARAVPRHAHLVGHAVRGLARHDVREQLDPGIVRSGRDPARHGAHARRDEVLAEVLRQAADGARRRERPCGGDVQRAHRGQGLRRRGRCDPQIRTLQQRPVRLGMEEPGSSRAS